MSNEKDLKVDAMFENVARILKELEMTQVWLEFEGSGDEGMLELSSFENTETGDTIGLLDNCADNYGPTPDVWTEEGNIAIETAIEKFVDGQGWIKEKVTQEVPWSRAILDLAYLAMDEEIGEWEVNEGSFGHMIIKPTLVTIWQTRRVEVEDEDGYHDEHEDCVGEFSRPYIEPEEVEEVEDEWVDDDDDDDDTSDEE